MMRLQFKLLYNYMKFIGIKMIEIEIPHVFPCIYSVTYSRRQK